MTENAPTLMRLETLEAAQSIARQRDRTRNLLGDLGARLTDKPPPLVVTCARGSSDHAANFAKYAIESRTGALVCSYAPSMSSIHGQTFPALKGAVFILISQSGRSPDLLASLATAKAAGALTVAMVNDETSPAAHEADILVPLCAGPERAVAATKSYIASLSAITGLVAAWTGDSTLNAALDSAPAALEQASALDWSDAQPAFDAVRNCFTLGRGVTFGVASEAALKLKETSGLHAECFSAAEVRHGPMAIVDEGFPALMFVPDGPASSGFASLAATMRQRGAAVFAAGGDAAGIAAAGAVALPVVEGLHPLVAPMAQVTAFYGFADRLSRARGHNPDAPPGLSKVTETY